MKESARFWDLFDNSRQELLLQAFKRDREVDDVGLDVHRRQEVGVRHRRRHVQPEIQGFITGGVSNIEAFHVCTSFRRIQKMTFHFIYTF